MWINSVKFNKIGNVSVLIHSENFELLGKVAYDAKLRFFDIYELIEKIESVLEMLETEKDNEAKKRG
ncbi:hypothetical protein EC513_08125 [Helicobacter pylori]|nr:hypothetical protein EC513_08125 [Helicobacter pylori]